LDAKAKSAEEMAEAMGLSPSKADLLEITERYRRLAEQARKAKDQTNRSTG
jgi:hypothetical protein